MPTFRSALTISQEYDGSGGSTMTVPLTGAQVGDTVVVLHGIDYANNPNNGNGIPAMTGSGITVTTRTTLTFATESSNAAFVAASTAVVTSASSPSFTVGSGSRDSEVVAAWAILPGQWDFVSAGTTGTSTTSSNTIDTPTLAAAAGDTWFGAYVSEYQHTGQWTLPAGTSGGVHFFGQADEGAAGACWEDLVAGDISGGQVAGRTGTKTGTARRRSAAAIVMRPSGAVLDSTDSATLTEASSVARSSATSDTAAVTDLHVLSASTVVVDSAAAADNWTLQQGRAVADSATLNEVVERTAIDYRTSEDTATLTDAVAVDIPELLASSDSATATDVIGPMSATAAAAETAAVSETLVVARTSAVTDSAAVADVTTVLRASAVVDTASLGESFTLTTLAVLTENAALVETIQIERFSAVTETATATDSIASGPLTLDTALLTESVEVIVIPAVAAATDGGESGQRVNYELQCIARIPQQTGPPALLVVDRIKWKGLRYADVLSRPQELAATVQVASISDLVAQRLLGPDRQATELRLLRDGQIVAAGPLAGWHRRGPDVELVAGGLLSYTQRMIVLADMRFDQVDQHLIAAALIDQWQTSSYGHGHYGIDTSRVSTSGRLRDRSYVRNEQHKVAQRIEELGAVDGGFDAEVDPTTRQLQLWHPFKGVDRSSGPSAVVLDRRVIASPDVMCSVAPGDLASLAFGTSSSAGSVGGLSSIQVNAELAASFGLSAAMGSWQDISEQATLDDHVRALLDARSHALIVPGPQMRVTPDADLGAYDVGDTVQLELGTDQLGITGAYRIRKRSVSVAANGVETVDLELV